MSVPSGNVGLKCFKSYCPKGQATRKMRPRQKDVVSYAAGIQKLGGDEE